jgi:tryptophan halogenase
MTGERIRRVAILGGGAAGWMCAAALSKVSARLFDVTLIESDEIGIIGVGEATIPTIHWFNQFVGLNPDEFMRETRATFKLGIEFVDWYRPGERYFHPFGRYGLAADPIAFHHRWIRSREPGHSRFDFENFALATLAARAGRFGFPTSDPKSPLASLGYAFQFDANLYAKYLRRLSEGRGVRRVEGKVTNIVRADDGDIATLHTDRGESISADLFVDCSGMRALLIGGQLAVELEDWSQWLPCDRALAVACELAHPPEPFTRATARAAGWQWRIPLQHRIGNGLVYCSAHLSDDEATATLVANLEGKALAEPRLIRFRVGRRQPSWVRNVVAVGLSAGFLEPLESTTIHLIQSAIAKLLSLFPARDSIAMSAQQFNRLMREEYDRIRDFLILHYHSTTRSEPLWQHCRDVEIPDSLRYKIEHFTRTGRLMLETDELFRDASWFSVLVGQNHLPQDYNPLLDAEAAVANAQVLSEQRRVLASAVAAMPTHLDILKRILNTTTVQGA